jgi:hypothetical protein
MSYLLAQWLKTLSMSCEVDAATLDDKFRNGFLFGELLEKLNVQDAKGYHHGDSTDILTSNYIKLEKTLRKLGIKLTLSESITLISGNFY